MACWGMQVVTGGVQTFTSKKLGFFFAGASIASAVAVVAFCPDFAWLVKPPETGALHARSSKSARIICILPVNFVASLNRFEMDRISGESGSAR